MAAITNPGTKVTEFSGEFKALSMYNLAMASADEYSLDPECLCLHERWTGRWIHGSSGEFFRLSYNHHSSW